MKLVSLAPLLLRTGHLFEAGILLLNKVLVALGESGLLQGAELEEAKVHIANVVSAVSNVVHHARQRADAHDQKKHEEQQGKGDAETKPRILKRSSSAPATPPEQVRPRRLRGEKTNVLSVPPLLLPEVPGFRVPTSDEMEDTKDM